MASVRLIGVSRTYTGRERAAVEDVTLEIHDKEFFVLLGPSGCGKSSLLKLVAGLEEPDAGQIWLDDRLVNYTSPGARNVAMVFQNYALYPHMSVRENIRFPLRMRKVDKRTQAARVLEVARVLELEDELDRWVGELSGGQRQRVALARAIVRDPAAMLMDEPLSNLDALLRMQTREELMRLHRAVPGTVVYVTHDQVEALTMGDRIGVMNHGRLVQVAAPAELYRAPLDTFVAGFIGTPPMNLLPGRLTERAGVLAFEGPGVDLVVPPELRAGLNGGASREVILGVRPEWLGVRNVAPAADTAWSVELIEQLGVEAIATVRNGAELVRARLAHDAPAVQAGPAELHVEPTRVQLFDAATRRNLLASGASAPEGTR